MPSCLTPVKLDESKLAYSGNGMWKSANPCYFNTGVMVMDLGKWRRFGYTCRIRRWMEVQKTSASRIYELGSLPPFLLVFAGHVAPIEDRWNQHELGGDNVRGSCRDLHPGPVSLLHWSGSGKPWLRLDSKQPCPFDSLWAPYDLYGHSSCKRFLFRHCNSCAPSFSRFHANPRQTPLSLLSLSTSPLSSVHFSPKKKQRKERNPNKTEEKIKKKKKKPTKNNEIPPLKMEQ